MRVLIVSAAILACACGRPSGLVAPLAPLYYSVNGGDVAAAATDIRVQAEDHARAAVDAQREWTERAIETHNENARDYVDQAKEINEERFWNVEDQKWQTFDAIKTAESQLDGASAAVSPVLAKSLVAAPLVTVQQPLPIAQTYAAPQQLAIAQPVALAQPLAYSTIVKPETKTIVTQSLSQTHPAPAYAAPAIISEPIIKTSPIIETAPIIEAAPIVEAAIAPAQKTIVTQSLSQTHPAPLIAQPVLKYAEPLVEVAQPALTATVVQPETRSVVTSSLSQTHGAPLAAPYLQPAAGIVAAPYAYSAPLYKSDILATAW